MPFFAVRVPVLRSRPILASETQRSRSSTVWRSGPLTAGSCPRRTLASPDSVSQMSSPTLCLRSSSGGRTGSGNRIACPRSHRTGGPGRSRTRGSHEPLIPTTPRMWRGHLNSGLPLRRSTGPAKDRDPRSRGPLPITERIHGGHDPDPSHPLCRASAALIAPATVDGGGGKTPPTASCGVVSAVNGVLSRKNQVSTGWSSNATSFTSAVPRSPGTERS